MKRGIMFKVIMLTVLLILFGCTALLIPETKNPAEKIEWANTALKMKRPLPAERLLKEAIPSLKQENDIGMLSYAYNTYGRLDYSFPEANDHNHAKAIANFEKSLEYFKQYLHADKSDKTNKYHKIYYQCATNSAFMLGKLNQASNKDLSCKYFDKSFEYYKKNIELSLDANVMAPGFNSFEEAIRKNKEKSNCTK